MAYFLGVLLTPFARIMKEYSMHSVMEIEEKIRQRYRQPKGVEQFGIEPVPPELKTVRWHDIFAIIFGFPGNMLQGTVVRLNLMRWTTPDGIDVPSSGR